MAYAKPRAAGALLSLATSSTWVPFATELVTRRSRAATTVGVHPASQLQRTLHKCADVSTTKAYLRDPLHPIELNWAGDALHINALVDITEDLPLLRFSAQDLLTRASTDLSHYKWASVVRKAYPLLDVRDVLVHADASEDWQLANAIGQALALSPGVEPLERMGGSYEGVVGVRALLNGLDIADDGADLYACFEPDCFNVRPYWTASHTCRDATGDVI